MAILDYASNAEDFIRDKVKNDGDGGDRESVAVIQKAVDDNSNGDASDQSDDFNGSHVFDPNSHDRISASQLADIFSKLNPNAQEFVPPSHNNRNNKKKDGHLNNKRRTSNRLLKPQWDASIRRTVYVSFIDPHVTEEQLADLFHTCGQVVDCRVCGDPRQAVLRFAFVEFTDEDEALKALELSGTFLGLNPIRVLPSKTAIIPVNPTFLPQSEDEREMCARTVYCTNIDKRVTQAEIKQFFETFCGQVARLRLLGEYRHSTRIAFVEFIMAESAIAALNCSGFKLCSLPIRVSPSKTPVRPCMSKPYLM